MINYRVILFFTLLLSLGMITTQAYAETVVIVGSEDAYVDEDAKDDNFGQSEFLTSGWTNTSELDHSDLKQVISYIEFDLNKIPKSNWLETVVIDSAKLNLSAEAVYGNAEIFLIHVYHCKDNGSWLENEITWNNRNCKNITEFHLTDSKFINPSELPKKYDWDITMNIRESIALNNLKTTLVVKMSDKQHVVIGKIGDGDPEIITSLVQFSSSETDKSSGMAPKLIVSYSTILFTQYGIFIIVISVVSIMGTIFTLFPKIKDIIKRISG